MSAESLKSFIKAAYLLQLRHGPFTSGELAEYTRESDVSQILAELLNLGFLSEHHSGSERQYTLTEKGRAQIKVVLAGGVYDVLHLGHLAALTEAKSLGDVLVAVVATDVTVGMLKGRRPIFPEEDRRALVEGLRPVDKAILGYEDVGMGYEQVLKDVMPDTVAFGYDQENLEHSVREIIERKHMGIKLQRLSRFDREKYLSSTRIREELTKRNDRISKTE